MCIAFYPDSQHIAAVHQKRINIEMAAKEGSLYAAEPDSVEPEVGLPVDAVEIEERAPAGCPLIVELLPIPEIAVEERIGNLAPGIAISRIRNSTGTYVIGKNSPRNGRRQPA